MIATWSGATRWHKVTEKELTPAERKTLGRFLSRQSWLQVKCSGVSFQRRNPTHTVFEQCAPYHIELCRRCYR